MLEDDKDHQKTPSSPVQVPVGGRPETEITDAAPLTFLRPNTASTKKPFLDKQQQKLSDSK